MATTYNKAELENSMKAIERDEYDDLKPNEQREYLELLALEKREREQKKSDQPRLQSMSSMMTQKQKRTNSGTGGEITLPTNVDALPSIWESCC